MNCFLKFLGVLDKQDEIHFVKFEQGLNIITGRSSTGKSALIEIFDYCFGGSDYTIPEGKITQNAKIYFIVLRFPERDLVLARKADRKSNKAFIKEIDHIAFEAGQPFSFPTDFFDEMSFIQLRSFKKELGRFLGLDIEDIDENLNDRQYRNKKQPTPSIRSFTSFMLQHQNLVANKHALFYRFDEKEKREQAIDHLKIFLGYVDQQYFLLEQKKNELVEQIRRQTIEMDRRNKKDEAAEVALDKLMRNYMSISGRELFSESPKNIILNPKKYLDQLQHLSIHNLPMDSSSDEYSKLKEELELKRSHLLAEVRAMAFERCAIKSTLEQAEIYKDDLNKIEYPQSARDGTAKCFFCKQDTNTPEREASSLEKAISWLNKELQKSTYVKDSLQPKLDEIEREIKNKKIGICDLEARIKNGEHELFLLEKGRPIGELILKAKLEIELFLEDKLALLTEDLDQGLALLQEQVKDIRGKIKKYDTSKKLGEAYEYLRIEMAKIGNNLDFEPFYKPIQLHFNLESFDLYHQGEDNKIFLRSMGSGANWLYCHLCLFLALQKLFCKLGKDCKIPPILFLDQPSQVYFPNTSLDNKEEFFARDMVPADKKESADDDIKSVGRFFSEIIDHCERTYIETKIMPQIIVTDHADNLELEADKKFEDYVRARWRGTEDGFIS